MFGWRCDVANSIDEREHRSQHDTGEGMSLLQIKKAWPILASLSVWIGMDNTMYSNINY